MVSFYTYYFNNKVILIYNIVKCDIKMQGKIQPIDYVVPTIYSAEKGDSKVRLVFIIKREELFPSDTGFALKEIMGFLAKNRLDIEIINAFPINDDRLFFDIIFSYKVSKEELINKMTQFFDKVINEGRIEGYQLFFPESTNIIFSPFIKSLITPCGHRLLLWGEPNINGSFVKVRMEYGELGKLLVDKLGEYVGQELAKSYIKAGAKDIVEGIKHLLYGGQAKGAYHIKEFKTSFSRDKITFRIVMDSHVEEEALRKNGINECSSYQIGVFKGFIMEYTKKNVDPNSVRQLRCIGKGDDYSIFIIEARSK